MRNKRRNIFLLFWIVIFPAVFLLKPAIDLFVYAQMEEEHRPIDMMIVIDNSGSMFQGDEKKGQVGNDANFLRITGANLFIARLGFDEANESEYQVGIVNLGYPSRLISPLQPLRESTRDMLAAQIANPQPEDYTEMVPALELAYRELTTSPNRKPDNLPAVVLITDGRPTAPEDQEGEQSNEDIRKLVESHPDIPLFIMLLQNPDRPDPVFEQYIDFWQKMQVENAHVTTYRIRDDEQIEATYNEIIAQLQNTISPPSGVDVEPGIPYQVFVNRYVKRMFITVIHKVGAPKGKVEIQDPAGNLVLPDEAGVHRFLGADNPVEVIAISSPRLNDSLKEDFWTITSDVPVRVFLDREGSYRIHFLEPSVINTEITNVYLASGRHSPRQELVIRFDLRTEDGEVIEEKQEIQGEYILPNGDEGVLPVPADIEPDEAGVYEIRFDMAAAYPAIHSEPGRFIFTINAGVAGEEAASRVPVARAKLLVDAGRGPYFESINPQPLPCVAGKTVQLSVTVGDADTIVPDTIRIRVLGDGKEVVLSSAGSNIASGDVTELCQALLVARPCSTEESATLRLRLSAQMADDSPMIPVETTLPVQVAAPACTPTPTPTPEPTPTPTPTPIPDTDRDTFNDLVDKCPEQALWLGIRTFDGCPPPWWVLLIAGLLVLLALAGLIFYVIPTILVRVSPPPDGYYLICDPDKPGRASPRSIRAAGERNRTRKVTIGGGKRDTIFVKGLKPAQYTLTRDGERTILMGKGITKRTLKEFPETFREGNIKIVLGLDDRKIKC